MADEESIQGRSIRQYVATGEDIPEHVLETLKRFSFTNPEWAKKLLFENAFSMSERYFCNSSGSEGCRRFDDGKMQKLQVLLFRVFSTLYCKRDEVWKDFCYFMDEEGQLLRTKECPVPPAIIRSITDNCHGNRMAILSALSQHLLTEHERISGLEKLPQDKLEALKCAYFVVNSSQSEDVETEWALCCRVIDEEADALMQQYMSLPEFVRNICKTQTSDNFYKGMSAENKGDGSKDPANEGKDVSAEASTTEILLHGKPSFIDPTEDIPEAGKNSVVVDNDGDDETLAIVVEEERSVKLLNPSQVENYDSVLGNVSEQVHVAQEPEVLCLSGEIENANNYYKLPGKPSPSFCTNKRKEKRLESIEGDPQIKKPRYDMSHIHFGSERDKRKSNTTDQQPFLPRGIPVSVVSPQITGQKLPSHPQQLNAMVTDSPALPYQEIPLQAVAPQVCPQPIPQTECTIVQSTSQPFSFSSVSVPVPPIGPTFDLQVDSSNATEQSTPTAPDWPMLHLQYDQQPGHQVNKVFLPSTSFISYSHNSSKQSAPKTCPPKRTFSLKRGSDGISKQAATAALNHYQKTAESTILQSAEHSHIPTIPFQCPTRSSFSLQDGDSQRTTEQHARAGMNSCSSSQQNIAMTTMTIAVPTTMPAWVLINPHNQMSTTSSSELSPQITISKPYVQLAPTQGSRPKPPSSTTCNASPQKRINSTSSSGLLTKKPRTETTGSIVDELKHVSAHRLYVITELLKFVRGNNCLSTNPAAEPLDDKDLMEFKRLYRDIFKPKKLTLGKLHLKKMLREVAALSLHTFGLEEALDVQKAVREMSHVGLAKREKANRLARVVFSDQERAFCSATGKEGFVLFSASKLFVLRHAYFTAIGCEESMEAKEEEELFQILDSTGAHMRREMMQEAGVSGQGEASEWLRTEKKKAWSLLSLQQPPSEEMQPLDPTESRREYLDEGNLGCYVMTHLDWRIIRELGYWGDRSPSMCGINHLAKAIFSPEELLLCGKSANSLELPSVLLKLGFLRQAYFMLNPVKSEQSSFKEWIACCNTLEEFFDEIECQVAILRCAVIPAFVKVPTSNPQVRSRQQMSEAGDTAEMPVHSESQSSSSTISSHENDVNLIIPSQKPQLTDLEKVTEKLGSYVMTSVIAVHLSVVKCHSSADDREAIIRQILQKIIADDSTSNREGMHPARDGVYLAFLRQCIYWVFPEESNEQHAARWKRCVEYVISLLPIAKDETKEQQEKGISETSIETNIRTKNDMIETTHFLGHPCSEDTLGATVPTLGEVAEMNHIRENASGSKEMIVKELIMRVFTQNDLISIPVCRALRRLPCSNMKLTRLRHAYFWICPSQDPANCSGEWNKCWTYIGNVVKHMMESNEVFLSLIAVPRTKQSPADEKLDEENDKDHVPLFIKSGAVQSECSASWQCKKEYILPIPCKKKIAHTESGKAVPLPLGQFQKFGAYVMTAKEAEWMMSLKQRQKRQRLSQEDVVRIIVLELYTPCDIVYLHLLKRRHQFVFCPLKVAILRQVYFELYPPVSTSSSSLTSMFSHCWAHLALLAEEYRRDAMKTMIKRRVEVLTFKRTGNTGRQLSTLLRGPDRWTREKSEKQRGRPPLVSKRRGRPPLVSKRRGRPPLVSKPAVNGDFRWTREKSVSPRGRPPLVSKPAVNSDFTDTSSKAKLTDHHERLQDIGKGCLFTTPFFISSGAVKEDPRQLRNLQKKKVVEDNRPLRYVRDEDGKNVKMLYGMPCPLSKLGSYVMTLEEAEWVENLKRECKERSLNKRDCTELIAQNVFTVKEIRNFLIHKRNKQIVFHSMKLVILRQVYYLVYPPQQNHMPTVSWWHCWASFTRAFDRLRMCGIRLHIGSLAVPSRIEGKTKDKPKSVPERTTSAMKEECPEKSVMLKNPKVHGDSEKGKNVKGRKSDGRMPKAPSSGKVVDKVKENPFRPYFIRMLQCFSWDVHIVVKYLLKQLFTVEELIDSREAGKELDPGKLEAAIEAFSFICGPATSTDFHSFISEVIDGLPHETTCYWWEKGTPMSVRKQVAKCAKLTEYKEGSQERNQTQQHSFIADLAQTTQSVVKRNLMYSELLNENINNLSKYKLERCTFIAKKLVQVLFSFDELMTGNTTGSRGMCALDVKRMAILRHATFTIAGIAPSQRQKTWLSIYHDVDKEIQQLRCPFLYEDKRIEKLLECATVVITKKARGRSSSESDEPDMRIVSCSGLLPTGVHRELLQNAKNPSEILKKLMHYFMLKDEDWDHFISRAPSKLKIVEAVYLSICQVPTTEQRDVWKAALCTVKQFVNNASEISHGSTVSEKRSPGVQSTMTKGAEKIDTSVSRCKSHPGVQTKMAKEAAKGMKSKSSDHVVPPSSHLNASHSVENKNTNIQESEIPQIVLQLLKCYKWNPEMVVRILLQYCFTPEDLGSLLEKDILWDQKKKSKFDHAFREIFENDDRIQALSLVQQIVLNAPRRTKRSLCNVWAKSSKEHMVHKFASLTAYKEKRTVDDSAIYQAFIKDEFPSLPTNETRKCLFIMENLLQRFYSAEELIFSDCSGSPDWLVLDQRRQDVLEHVVCTIASVSQVKRQRVWEVCCKAIDRENSKHRKQLLEADRKIEEVVRSHSFNLDDHIPVPIQNQIKPYKDNAVAVIQSLVQQVFSPSELKTEVDEMPPAQMKLLQMLFFKMHDVGVSAHEESWDQALRTINYLNKISGYTFKDSGGVEAEQNPVKKTAVSRELWADSEMDTTEEVLGEDDASSNEEMPHKELISSDESSSGQGIAMNGTKIKDRNTVLTGNEQSETNFDAQTNLEWYAVEPVVNNLIGQVKTFQLEEDEIVDELVMHIFHAEEVLDNIDDCKSSSDKFELLKEAFLQIYDVPDHETELTERLKEQLSFSLENLHSLLKQHSEENTVLLESTSRTGNRPKSYPTLHDLDGKVAKMRSLLTVSFSADERIEMDVLKLRRLKASKVESVMKNFQDFCRKSGDEVERKSVMTLVYNLTVELQEHLQKNVRHKVDAFISALVETTVNCLEEKAKEQVTNEAGSATPLFHAVIMELGKVFKFTGFIPVVRVLLRYLFTPAEMKAMVDMGIDEPNSPFTSQLELMQRTIHKVLKTPPQDRTIVWLCTKWIIVKEMEDMTLLVRRKNVVGDIIFPVYNRKAVLKCVMGVCLSLEEQAEFLTNPSVFEESNASKVKQMKEVHFLMRHTQQSAQNHEWRLVSFPERNYPVTTATMVRRDNWKPGGKALNSEKEPAFPLHTNQNDSSQNIDYEARSAAERKNGSLAISKKAVAKPSDENVEESFNTAHGNKDTSKGVSSAIQSDGIKDECNACNQESTDDSDVHTQRRKTIVVLVDYKTCDKVCRIMAEEERKANGAEGNVGSAMVETEDSHGNSNGNLTEQKIVNSVCSHDEPGKLPDNEIVHSDGDKTYDSVITSEMKQNSKLDDDDEQKSYIEEEADNESSVHDGIKSDQLLSDQGTVHKLGLGTFSETTQLLKEPCEESSNPEQPVASEEQMITSENEEFRIETETSELTDISGINSGDGSVQTNSEQRPFVDDGESHSSWMKEAEEGDIKESTRTVVLQKELANDMESSQADKVIDETIGDVRTERIQASIEDFEQGDCTGSKAEAKDLHGQDAEPEGKVSVTNSVPSLQSTSIVTTQENLQMGNLRDSFSTQTTNTVKPTNVNGSTSIVDETENYLNDAKPENEEGKVKPIEMSNAHYPEVQMLHSSSSEAVESDDILQAKETDVIIYTEADESESCNNGDYNDDLCRARADETQLLSGIEDSCAKHQDSKQITSNVLRPQSDVIDEVPSKIMANTEVDGGWTLEQKSETSSFQVPRVEGAHPQEHDASAKTSIEQVNDSVIGTPSDSTRKEREAEICFPAVDVPVLSSEPNRNESGSECANSTDITGCSTGNTQDAAIDEKICRTEVQTEPTRNEPGSQCAISTNITGCSTGSTQDAATDEKICRTEAQTVGERDDGAGSDHYGSFPPNSEQHVGQERRKGGSKSSTCTPEISLETQEEGKNNENCEQVVGLSPPRSQPERTSDSGSLVLTPRRPPVKVDPNRCTDVPFQPLDDSNFDLLLYAAEIKGQGKCDNDSGIKKSDSVDESQSKEQV